MINSSKKKKKNCVMVASDGKTGRQPLQLQDHPNVYGNANVHQPAIMRNPPTGVTGPKSRGPPKPPKTNTKNEKKVI